jgi:hypothetical protein
LLPVSRSASAALHDREQRAEKRGFRGVGAPDGDVGHLDAEIHERSPYRRAEVRSIRTKGSAASVQEARAVLRSEGEPKPTRYERPNRLTVAAVRRQVQHYSAGADRRNDIVIEARTQAPWPHQYRLFRKVGDAKLRLLREPMSIRQADPNLRPRENEAPQRRIVRQLIAVGERDVTEAESLPLLGAAIVDVRWCRPRRCEERQGVG